MHPLQLRIAFKCLLVQRANRPLSRRNISFTPRLRAAENPESFIAQFNNSPLMRQLADKPEALRALNEFANLMKDSGIEISPSSPPTTMQMFRLVSNAKFRESAKRVIDEMRKAGVDINSQNAFELLTGRKPPGT